MKISIAGLFAAIVSLLEADVGYRFFRSNNESLTQNGGSPSPGVHLINEPGLQNSRTRGPGIRLHDEPVTQNGGTAIPGINLNNESVTQSSETAFAVVSSNNESMAQNGVTVLEDQDYQNYGKMMYKNIRSKFEI